MGNAFRKNAIEIIGLIGSIMTIISFVFTFFDIEVDKIVIDFSFLFGNLAKWVFGVSLCISLFSMIYLLYIKKIFNKRKDKLIEKYNEIISYFQNIIICNNMIDYEFLAKLIIEMYSSINNAKIEVSIKKIEDNKMVSNIYSTKEINKEVRLHVNEYFLEILKGKNKFIFNKNQFLRRFKCFNSDYENFYSSSLILPIKESREIVGLLCLESIKRNAFNKDITNGIEPLLDTITKFLYIMLHK